MKSFRRVLKIKNNHKKQNGIFYNYSKYSILTQLEKTETDHEWMDLSQNENPEPPKKRGRPNKPSKKLGSLKSLKQLGRRTKTVFDSLVKECEENQIDFGTFLGFMGRRYYSVKNCLVIISFLTASNVLAALGIIFS